MNKSFHLIFALISFLLLNTLCFAQNPLNLGSNIRTADLSGHVWKDGRMYLYTSHDKECQPDFYMKDWSVFSSNDLINWIDHGSILSVDDISWADNYAWASDCAYKKGKYTTGGRGGVEYEVTNLNVTGIGSLGAAIDISGSRTVVFMVSGTITGNFDIKNGDITIAGQTAPGDGICIRGYLNIRAENVIIRYIRLRNDPVINPDCDAIFGRYQKNIILDHVSASWSTDEVLSVYMNEHVTIQWCMITEACPKDGGDSHRFGGIAGNSYGTMHHNLIAHNKSRNQRWASGCGYNDYRNSVIYNWEYNSAYGGEKSLSDSDFGFTTVNMIANYYKADSATRTSVTRRIVQPSARSESDKGDWYVADTWKGVDGDNYIKMNAPWDVMPIKQHSAQVICLK